MSAPFARLLTLLTSLATPATAEVCQQTGPTCAFRYAFETVFESAGFPRPRDTGFPQLYQDGGKPIARYAYHIAVDDRVSEAFAQHHMSFAAAVSSFSSALKSNLCADVSTADFVTAGGTVEYWIGLHPDWENGETDVVGFPNNGFPNNFLVRVETCEAP